MPGTKLLSALPLACLFILTLQQTAKAHYADAEHHEDLHRLQHEMADIAQALLDAVDGPPGRIEVAVGYDRQELLRRDMDDDNRIDYIYWPHLRAGLPLEYMSADQKMLVHELLLSALSAKGYLSAVQIMQMEEVLADLEVIGFPRGSGRYNLTIFGEPGIENEWGWRFEGHHLSLNFTLTPQGISVTPSFWGAAPAQIRSGNLAGFRNLQHLHHAGLTLINALSLSQQAQAIEPGAPPNDILAGTLDLPREAWDDWKELGETGIHVATLADEQKALVQRIIDEVITAYRPEISASYLQQIDINEIWFTWIGGTTENEPHYYRLDGPDFFFEYDLVQNEGNHVHTVWRSKSGDFGADLLIRHRREHDHSEPHSH